MLLQGLLPGALAEWLDHQWVQLFLLPGLGAAGLALVARWGERRRMRRSDPDAVGFMPWRTVAFFSLFAACVLLGLALRAAWQAPVPPKDAPQLLP